MAQYLKDEVERRIAAAALTTFAEAGFAAASMAGIARRADVSTGNVYRYFENKEVLFLAVVPEALARRLLALLRARVRTLTLEKSTGHPRAAFAHRAAAEELLAFSIQHRLEVVILLERAAGTIHEGFAEKVRALLVQLAIFHFRGHDGLTPDEPLAFVLTLIYDAWLGAMTRILRTCSEEPRIRACVGEYTRYHLTGLEALFGAE